MVSSEIKKKMYIAKTWKHKTAVFTKPTTCEKFFCMFIHTLHTKKRVKKANYILVVYKRLTPPPLNHLGKHINIHIK